MRSAAGDIFNRRAQAGIQLPTNKPRRLTLWAAGVASLVLLLMLTTAGSSAQAGCPDPASLAGQTRGKAGLQGDEECGPYWVPISSPNSGSDGSKLYGIDAVSATNVWAVGNAGNGSADRTLIERWNGTSWQVVASPNVNANYHYLGAVAAVSSTDVWAVGTYYSGAVAKTLILRWNGATWSIVASPNIGANSNSLSAVAVVSANDVWAVGQYFDGSHNQTLIMRWNGTTWNTVSSPNVGANSNVLYGVTAVSATDVWAVGQYFNGSVNRTLIMRWNGATWSVVTSPNVGASDNTLNEVSFVSAADVWAVGYYREVATYRTLTMHWNGSAWSVIPSPNIGTENNSLSGVTAVSANNVWAVGYYGLITPQTLIMNWNGTSWNIVESRNLGSQSNYLTAVTAVAVDDVWASGYYLGGGVNSTTIHRYHPCCSLAFTDVTPGTTFHEYVQCLACRDILGGYDTGCETGNPCFRPNNNVTRGQLAKIVSNSAAFAEPVGAQQYQDVPPGSTFYDFVWRLSDRGIISGYPCGGPGEPCIGPGNRPYYRPNANMTRGQTSKVVATAMGLPAPPGGQRTFEDVTIGSTFWSWIESLSTAGSISGYPCGGPGEPCIGPGNRPYFRPGNNVTRGQAAKIVSSTFFPDCGMHLAK